MENCFFVIKRCYQNFVFYYGHIIWNQQAVF